MAIEDVVLTHPYCYDLKRHLARLWNRAVAAGDTAQQEFIQFAIDEALIGRNQERPFQRIRFKSDPTGYLGRHLKWLLSDAVYASLDNADIRTDLNALSAEVSVYPRYWNPGHYVDFLRYVQFVNTEPQRTTKYNNALNEANVAGIQVRAYWSDIETAPSTFNWTELDFAIAAAAAKSKQVIFNIADKTYSAVNAGPSDLLAYQWPRSSGGYTMSRWDNATRDRWLALIDAIATRYGSNPAFGGMQIEETSIGLSEANVTASGYTAAAHEQWHKDVFLGMMRRLPRQRIFFCMNFFYDDDDAMSRIADTIAPYGGVMGGPDIFPYRSSLLTRAYPRYTEQKDKQPLYCSVMPDSYEYCDNDTDYAVTSCVGANLMTMTQIFEWGRDNLHLNYVFWTYQESGAQVFMTHGLPVIQANATFNVENW